VGEREVIGVEDGSFLKKSVKCTAGLGKFWNGSASRAESGLEVSVVGVVDLKSNTCYSLEARQTVDEEGVSRMGGNRWLLLKTVIH
jgi:hypothetical protein